MAEKKQIICPNCQAKLKFDPDKITSDVIKFKCPGCAAVLRIRKPDTPKETPLPAAAGQAESTFKNTDAEHLEPENRAVPENAAGVEPAVPEKTEEEVPAAQETLSEEKYSPSIPADRPVVPEEPVESLHGDSAYEDLSEPASRAETEKAAGVEPAVPEKTEEEAQATQETLSEENRVVCHYCNAKLKYDPARITAEVVKTKCPGCGSVLVIRKPGAQQEPLSPPPPVSQPEPEITKPATEDLSVDSKTRIEEDLNAVDQAEQAGEPVSPPAAEKTGEEIPEPEETLPKAVYGPLVPEDRLVASQEPGESLLEDFDHENLREYEEGEAEAGDLEWTRYADKKGPKLPDSKIDLNVIPASIDGLHDTLADLQQAEMYNLQGEANLEKNHITQAIRDFNNALDINPDYVDALVNRGSAFVLQNEYNDALRDFNHALELGGRQAEIYNIRGEIYLLNRMYDEAIKDFTAAIILNPIYSDAYLNRAKAYNEKGMKEEAEADFSQAIRSDSDKFSSYADLTASESLFEEETLSSKEKAAKFMQMGLIELKNENYPQAIENFTQVINLSPDNAMAYINRGQAYIELNQADEAMVDLKRAVIYDPLNPSLYYWRAMAWKLMDSPINMVSDLKLSCELGYQPACEEYEKCKPQKH